MKSALGKPPSYEANRRWRRGERARDRPKEISMECVRDGGASCRGIICTRRDHDNNSHGKNVAELNNINQEPVLKG